MWQRQPKIFRTETIDWIRFCLFWYLTKHVSKHVFDWTEALLFQHCRSFPDSHKVVILFLFFNGKNILAIFVRLPAPGLLRLVAASSSAGGRFSSLSSRSAALVAFWEVERQALIPPRDHNGVITVLRCPVSRLLTLSPAASLWPKCAFISTKDAEISFATAPRLCSRGTKRILLSITMRFMQGAISARRGGETRGKIE